MSATILIFPKQSRRKRVWVHNYREGDPLPANVAARRIEYAPPPSFERTPELLILIAVMKALPADVRDQARRTIRQAAQHFGDKARLAAKHIVWMIDP